MVARSPLNRITPLAFEMPLGTSATLNEAFWTSMRPLICGCVQRARAPRHPPARLPKRSRPVEVVEDGQIDAALWRADPGRIFGSSNILPETRRSVADPTRWALCHGDHGVGHGDHQGPELRSASSAGTPSPARAELEFRDAQFGLDVARAQRRAVDAQRALRRIRAKARRRRTAAGSDPARQLRQIQPGEGEVALPGIIAFQPPLAVARMVEPAKSDSRCARSRPSELAVRCASPTAARPVAGRARRRRRAARRCGNPGARWLAGARSSAPWRWPGPVPPIPGRALARRLNLVQRHGVGGDLEAQAGRHSSRYRSAS